MMVPYAFAKAHSVLPAGERDGRLLLWVTRDTPPAAIGELRRSLGRDIQPPSSDRAVPDTDNEIWHDRGQDNGAVDLKPCRAARQCGSHIDPRYVANRLDRSIGHLLHAQKPLLGEHRLDDGIASRAYADGMRVRLDLFE